MIIRIPTIQPAIFEIKVLPLLNRGFLVGTKPISCHKCDDDWHIIADVSLPYLPDDSLRYLCAKLPHFYFYDYLLVIVTDRNNLLRFGVVARVAVLCWATTPTDETPERRTRYASAASACPPAEPEGRRRAGLKQDRRSRIGEAGDGPATLRSGQTASRDAELTKRARGTETLKTMTCKQLGGPCDLQLQGNTANEVIKLQDKHLNEIVADGDGEHKDALKEMKDRWKHPLAGMGWYRKAKRDFAALPEG